MADDEDSDVFEITDFTTATDWERFIAKIEEAIHEWKLTNPRNLLPLKKDELSSSEWTEKTREINFADFPFTITYHTLKTAETSSEMTSTDDGDREDEIPMVHQDLMSLENDFCPRAHCLCRWYGLRSFLVICPSSTADDVAIMSESRIALLRSSAAVAINNTKCQVPVFVQVCQRWRRLYLGHCEFPGVRTSFDIVHLRRVPRQLTHLAGLLDIFKSKVGNQAPLPPVNVSIRFTYILNDWQQHGWPQSPPVLSHERKNISHLAQDLNSAYGNDIGYVDFKTLPFGACEDPVSELHLSATWPTISEEMIVDNDVYSDLDPLQAPHWSVRVHMTADPQCLLAEHFFEFLELCRRHESTNQLLGKSLIVEDDTESSDISQALQRLTEPKAVYSLPSLSKVISNSRQSLKLKPGEAPIPDDLLNKLLLFLFPDADKDNGVTSQSEQSEENNEAKELDPNDLSRQLKSAPQDCLTSKLAVLLCVVNHSLGGLHAVAHLWQEFVLEMRYRYENNYLICGLEQSSPNMGCCLLHQKLQMLNCCIERKKTREQQQEQQMTQSSSCGQMSESSSYPVLSAASSVSDFLAKNDAEGQLDNDEGGIISSVGVGLSKADKDSPGSVQSKTQDDRTAVGGAIERTRSAVLESSSSDDEEFFECEGEESSADVDMSSPKEDVNKMEKVAACGDVEAPAGGWEDFDMDIVGGEDGDNEESGETDKLAQGEGAIQGATRDEVVDEGSEVVDSSAIKIGADVSKDMVTNTQQQQQPSYKPEGRLRPHGDLRLLNVDEPLYIPVTQEPAPMTEDMLEQHAEVLAKLGTSEEGAHLRARMQSACLLSDMESFKAANPGCSLEDFVRWYSPRDYVTEEVVLEDGSKTIKGHLSQRMQIPGNMWAEVWTSARPVPARRQKRLFDDTKEAEKVLHFLAALKPGELAKYLLPMIVQSGILSIMQHNEHELTNVQALVQQLIKKSSKVTRAPVTDLPKYEDIVKQMELAETVLARARSLRAKFDLQQAKTKDVHELERFVTSLLEHPEVPVLGASRGPAGQVIHHLFSAAQHAQATVAGDDSSATSPDTSVREFPSPAGREFILRTVAPRPAPYSRLCPHRMFCVVTPDGFRLAGAFSEDTTFQ